MASVSGFSPIERRSQRDAPPFFEGVLDFVPSLTNEDEKKVALDMFEHAVRRRSRDFRFGMGANMKNTTYKALALGVATVFCAACSNSSPSVTPVPAATATPAPTATAVVSATPTATPTSPPTATPSPTATPTPVSSPTPTATPVTPTPTPSGAATPGPLVVSPTSFSFTNTGTAFAQILTVTQTGNPDDNFAVGVANAAVATLKTAPGAGMFSVIPVGSGMTTITVSGAGGITTTIPVTVTTTSATLSARKR